MDIAKKGEVVLRTAREQDLQAVDDLTILCYTPIFESYVAMLGEACYQAVRHEPHLTWEQRKVAQVRGLYAEHPDWVWVLEGPEGFFGFISFHLFPLQNYGHIDNNGVHPDYAGQGWGKFMYQWVLDYFRKQGLGYAHVDTGLDPVHIPARKAYESVGFDRQVPSVEYWQDLQLKNQGSLPE